MKKFRVLLVENERPVASKIKMEIKQLGYEVLVVVGSYHEAVSMYKRSLPDLTLIDLNLKGKKSGVDLANFIRSYKQPGPFVYLFDKLDQQTIQLAKMTMPAGYLEKPIRKATLHACLETVLYKHANVEESKKTMTISNSKKKQVLQVNNILFLRADHVYVQIHLAQGQKLVRRGSLSEFLEELPGDQFIQTHRSYAVNIQQIKGWDKQYVYIEGQAIPLSRSRRKNVINRLGGRAPNS